MNLDFALFEYFPYGGLQRDCLSIALKCAERGHRVRCYTRKWHDDFPEAIEVIELGTRGGSNIARDQAFASQLHERLSKTQSVPVIGFNRMPGLDIYFAADPCYVAKAKRLKPFWQRWTPRYRHFRRQEKAIFSADSSTQILLLTDHEIPLYQHYYGTPMERFHRLTPIAKRRAYSKEQKLMARSRVRNEHGWRNKECLLLFVGSGFRVKGLDRAIRALAALDYTNRKNARLVVIGSGNPKPFQSLAEKLNVGDHIDFLGGRDDVYDYMLASDLLVHPARSESAGVVLLEALTAGLPVIATGACGYARHIAKAEAGIVVLEPFHPLIFELSLATMLATLTTNNWQQNALDYAATTDLYSGHQRAVDLIEQIANRKP